MSRLAARTGFERNAKKVYKMAVMRNTVLPLENAVAFITKFKFSMQRLI